MRTVTDHTPTRTGHVSLGGISHTRPVPWCANPDSAAPVKRCTSDGDVKVFLSVI